MGIWYTGPYENGGFLTNALLGHPQKKSDTKERP